MRWLWLLVVSGCGRIGFDATRADATEPSNCLAHPTALFCEDFESDLAAWQVNGNSARQTAAAHTGSGSLYSATTTTPGTAYVRHPVGPIGTPQNVAARAWIYVPSGLDLVQTDLLSLVSGGSGQFFSFYIHNNAAAFYVQTSITSGFNSGFAIPVDRWFCVEFRVALANAGGSFELRIDDQPVDTETGFDTQPGSDFTSLTTGITFEGTGQLGPVTIFTDDVILDTAPIGCR